MCKESIKELEALTNLMPEGLSEVRSEENLRLYNTKHRNTVAIGLLRKDSVAVLEATMLRGDETGNHLHKEKEWIIIYEGMLKIIFDDRTEVLEARQCITIQPGETHNVIALADTNMIAITIPASKTFPDGPRK